MSTNKVSSINRYIDIRNKYHVVLFYNLSNVHRMEYIHYLSAYYKNAKTSLFCHHQLPKTFSSTLISEIRFT